MNVIRKGLAAFALAAVATGLLSPAAYAADYRYQVVGTGGIGVCERAEPRLGATRLGCIPEGGTVVANCWVVGDTVTDMWQGRMISWNHWARTPQNRYVSDLYLNSSSTSYPQCSATLPAPVTREARAVDFARSQLGVAYTSVTPDGMWSGWCELFVEQAYGTRGRYGSAIANYNAQRAAGRISTSTNPPAGALVFYSWGDYGHVGISLGNGQVISTQGYSTPLPVRQHTVTGIGLPYLGWSYAPSGWVGR